MRRIAVFFAIALTMLGITAAPASASSIIDKEVWAGAPVAGVWTSDAKTHHWLANAADKGDWAADIGVAAGTPVRVYVAPQKSGYTVTTKITQIGAGCTAGRNGASFVSVGIYVNGAKIGTLKLAHLRPSMSVGQSVNRWGGVVGTVAGGLPYDERCWTAPHTHVELMNVHNWSCYNRGYHVGSHLNMHDFVGFAGGKRVSDVLQACP